jgi:hypothetical protein
MGNVAVRARFGGDPVDEIAAQFFTVDLASAVVSRKYPGT